jgi:hypothetical protein
MRKAGVEAPASPEVTFSATRVDGTSELGPAIVIHCRSRSHAGGAAIGAAVIRRRRAPDLMLCACCDCIIPAGDVAVDVAQAGELLVVCGDCAGSA